MPADIGKAFGERNGFIDRRAGTEVFHVVKARAGKAGSGEPLQLGIRYRG